MSLIGIIGLYILKVGADSSVGGHNFFCPGQSQRSNMTWVLELQPSLEVVLDLGRPKVEPPRMFKSSLPSDHWHHMDGVVAE